MLNSPSRFKKTLTGSMLAFAVATSTVSLVPQKAEALILAKTSGDVLLGVVFLFVFFPVGIVLEDAKDTPEWIQGFYDKLPYLKGTQEGRKIEAKIVELFDIIKNETLKISNDLSDDDMKKAMKKLIKGHAEWQLDETKNTLAVKLDKNWIEGIFADNEFSKAQVQQAIQILTTF